MLAAGLDDYVRKPYRPDEIFDCMARHLGVRFRRAEAASVLREAQAAELNPDAIAALPAALRLELRSALIALDAIGFRGPWRRWRSMMPRWLPSCHVTQKI